jgi:hypothetical protein
MLCWKSGLRADGCPGGARRRRVGSPSPSTWRDGYSGPEAFIPGAATRTGLNGGNPVHGADGHPMARGANQSALTIDLQENANAAAAVTCQEGTPRPVVGDRGRSRLWHDRLRGPPSRAPGTVCPAAAALDAGGPASDAGPRHLHGHRVHGSPIPGYRSLDALRRLSSCMSPDRSPAPRGRTDRAAPG